MAQIEASEPAAAELDSGKAKKKTRPSRFLPSERIALQKQTDLLRSYGVTYETKGAAVTNQEVAPPAGLSASTAALMNPFFVDSGFLSKSEGSFTPAEGVVSYSRMYAWDAQAAGYKLRPIVEGSWFGQALLNHLRIGPKDEEQATAILAEAAAASSLEYRPQLKTLLEYMCIAGLVERDGTILRLAKHGSLSMAEAHDGERSRPKQEQPNPGSDGGRDATGAQIMRFSMSIDINLAEVSRWSPARITAFFGGVAQVLAAKAAIEKGEGG